MIDVDDYLFAIAILVCNFFQPSMPLTQTAGKLSRKYAGQSLEYGRAVSFHRYAVDRDTQRIYINIIIRASPLPPSIYYPFTTRTSAQHIRVDYFNAMRKTAENTARRFAAPWGDHIYTAKQR